MQATILLGRYYGYNNLDYEEVRSRSVKAGFSAIPFMPPDNVPAVPSFKARSTRPWIPRREDDRPDKSVAAYQDLIEKRMGYNTLVKYYISTGLRASQVICRNYLLGLEERNRYVQFLQDQYGVFNNVAGLVMGATNANGALRDAFSIAKIGVDGALDTYQEYRFLNVNYEEARVLVEAAQNVLADHYYNKVDGLAGPTRKDGRTIYNKMFTFSDALNAVSIIESQCTRPGIRRLVAKSLYASPTNMSVDPVTGTIIYLSNTSAGKLAEQVNGVTNNANQAGKPGHKPVEGAIGQAVPPPQ